MSQRLDQLRKLTQTGEFLFHGSPVRLEAIEPRQAYNHGQVDGPPAVAATPYYQLAIFRALMLAAKPKMPAGEYRSGFSFDDGQLSFRANQETLTAAKDVVGYVYVLDKKDFLEYSSMEYRSPNTVKPVQIIQVTSDDLPSGIRTIS